MAFKIGESGNPNGRPKGTGHRQQLFTNFVEPFNEALVGTAIRLALDGNENMLRLFLERILPSKPSSNPIAFDITGLDLTKTSSLLTVGKTVLEQVAHSELTAEQAKTVMTAMGLQSKHIETHELAQRISAIEKTLKRRK